MIDTSDGSALAEADWDPAGEPVERPGNPVEQLLVMEFTELRRGWALGSNYDRLHHDLNWEKSVEQLLRAYDRALE